MTRLTPTPSQTVGPFFAYGLIREDDAELARPGARGEPLRLSGVLKDKNGAPIRDALIEIWQADADGRYVGRDPDADPAFKGFGRTLTKADGAFSFQTVVPGVSAGSGNSLQAPHVAIGVFAAGLTRRVVTRAYLGEAPEPEGDGVLSALSEAQRASLAVRRTADGAAEIELRLGGDGAVTAFAD